MKKHTKLYKHILSGALLLATCSTLFAAPGPDVEKTKTYSKSYSISNNDKVNINNQFGEVKITTWNKNEVKVDVTITAKSSSDERAQAILDNITIEDSKNGDGVSFKTTMGKQEFKGDKKGNNNQGMEINYEVSMPASSALNLQNQFGKSFVPDMSGSVEIVQKFGELVAGNLPNAKDLHVEFGSAVVESIGNCKIVIKFSKAEIKKMNGSIKSNFEFCDKIKLTLDNNVTDFTMNNSYSKIEIAVAGSFGGDFEIHTSFGDFKNSSSLSLKEEKDDDENHGPRFDKDYSGKVGNGACKVKIKSSFGTVRFI
ncbi:MAG: hypothetical protein ABIU63_14025 [Chitinophagaceae bacterium]